MSNFLMGLEIAASGMSSQRTRLNIVSSNMANAETTRGEDGQAYRRQIARVEATRIAGFETAFSDALDPSLRGVSVTEVVDDQSPLRMVYDPSHPDADDEGMVSYPNVNIVSEMVDMVNAQRGFEANATAFQSLKQMAMRAIQIV